MNAQPRLKAWAHQATVHPIQPQLEGMVDAKAISKLLSIPVFSVLHLAKKGELPHYRVGRLIRFKWSEIEKATKQR